MRTIIIVFLGLMAASYAGRPEPSRQSVSHPPIMSSFDKSNSTKADIDTHLTKKPKRGGLDPDRFKRHVFILSEICPTEPRKMIFGDEIIVESQHPSYLHYKNGVACSTNFSRLDDDGGIILVLVNAETEDCKDYMQIDAMNDKTLIFCGESNQTGTSIIYENDNLQVTWHTDAHGGEELTHGTGVRILLTSFQNDCGEHQACFKCDNGLMIDQFHMCNGWNNCGDWSDEKHCPPVHGPGCGPPRPEQRKEHNWLITMSILFVAACLVAGVLGFMNYTMIKQRGREPVATGAESRSFLPNEGPAI